MKRALLCGTGVLCLIATGCYNKPETSLKKPGEGPANIHAAPAVGPGTTAGGSTAGPQPAKHDQGGHGTQAEDKSKVDTSRGHDEDHAPAAPAKH